jgi:hypothetical protein
MPPPINRSAAPAAPLRRDAGYHAPRAAIAHGDPPLSGMDPLRIAACAGRGRFEGRSEGRFQGRFQGRSG